MKENIVWDELFEPLSEIGYGGTSSVFKVKYKIDGKIYALKIMDFEITDRSKTDELKEFYREVDFLKKLRHQSIVSITDDFLIDNKPAILMEYVEGKSLAQLVREEKYLQADEVIEIARQIAAGLKECHNTINKEGDTSQQLAIIHNDIHSKNIIKTIDENGYPFYKLIDFGLSFTNADKADKEQKIHGMKEYKAPEKWSEEKIGTQSDIYSFGVVLYEMLAGQVPFPIDNYEDMEQELSLKNKILFEKAPNIWHIRKQKIESANFVTPEDPDYPQWLDLLILKCLQKSPAKRYTSGKELLEAVTAGSLSPMEAEWDMNLYQEAATPTETSQTKQNQTPANPPTRMQTHDTVKQRITTPIKSKRKWRTVPIIALAVIVLSSLAYVLIFQNKINEGNLEEITRAYYQADENAVDEASIDSLLEHFDFPVYYYNGFYTRQAFRHFYINKTNAEKKKITLDEITIDNTRKPAVVKVRGSFKTYRTKKSQKANYIGKIADEITINKGKIKRIVKE